MTYTELLDFIRNRMQMQHIYQLVMLQALMRGGGRCSAREIAEAFLKRDESQIDYYAEITKGMVGRVLRSHGIVLWDKQAKEFVVEKFADLTEAQIAEVVAACQVRLDEYLSERGDRVWRHRRQSERVSGTLQYEVLKRARRRCELCGISADDKYLQVDHILPRIRGGTNDIENLQALCYSCNAMKRDRDDTDFRGVEASYGLRRSACIFCRPEYVVEENALVYAVRDAFPVTAMHTLVIPKRHVVDYFDLTRPELNCFDALLRSQRQAIALADSNVSGFNVGINAGEVAGQTIPHAHIHLIPRRSGDVAEPRGGVRHTIPGKGNYPKHHE